MNDMIVLNDVTKSFLSDRSIKDKDGKPHWFTAVEPTSLTIKQGEIFGLMGYSGAGKSTLLRLINMLERPDSGQVIIDSTSDAAIGPIPVPTMALVNGLIAIIKITKGKARIKLVMPPSTPYSVLFCKNCRSLDKNKNTPNRPPMMMATVVEIPSIMKVSINALIISLRNTNSLSIEADNSVPVNISSLLPH